MERKCCIEAQARVHDRRRRFQNVQSAVFFLVENGGSMGSPKCNNSRAGFLDDGRVYLDDTYAPVQSEVRRDKDDIES
jgi:hypothetical protein